MEKQKLSMRMWGYLPAASLQRAPFLRPTRVLQSSLQENVRSVCGGGCGFGLALTESGKISMWGSPNDLGQSNIKGCPQDRMEPRVLDVNANVVQGAGGWAHSAVVTDKGNVCTWGWSQCVPTASLTAEEGAGGRDVYSQGDHSVAPLHLSFCDVSGASTASVSLESSKGISASSPGHYQRIAQSETSSVEHLSTGKAMLSNLVCKHTGLPSPIRFDNIEHVVQPLDTEVPASKNTRSVDSNMMIPPSFVSLAPGVIIKSVAAGGRHSLALSDVGKVWGWGYGGEGQLGVGYRLCMTSKPQLIKYLEAPYWTSYESHNQSKFAVPGLMDLPAAIFGNFVTKIACGGRHSAVVTDTGAVLSFGWGLYGQCGQGSTEDQLRPVYVSALGGIKVSDLAAGLWHTVFVTDAGDVYSSGGNQFGQLGTLGDQAEMLPTLVAAPVLENETATSVSCGARHTAVLTDKGKIFCWGWNKYGQLGLGDTRNRDAPVEVPLENAVARSMACGWWHTLALVEDGP